MNRVQGLVIGVIGVLLFSSKAVLVKLAYQYEIDPVSLLLLRMIFSLPFYILIALISGRKKNSALSKKEYGILILFGFLGYYLASYFDFLGLQFIKASLERLILFLYPTLVVFISYFFLKQEIKRNQIIAIAVSYLGIFILFFSELSIASNNSVWMGSMLIFLSAVTYASYLVGSGWLIPKLGATRFTSYAMIVSCISVLLHYSFSVESSILSFRNEVYWLGLLMAVFATVIPTYLISYSIKSLGATNFSVLGGLGPVSTVLLAYLFLNEQLAPMQIFGAIVVVGGVMLSEIVKRKGG